MVSVIRDGKRLTLREEDLTIPETESALEWLDHVFDSYRQHGDGISGKEAVSYRFMRQRLAEAGVPYYGRGP